MSTPSGLLLAQQLIRNHFGTIVAVRTLTSDSQSLTDFDRIVLLLESCFYCRRCVTVFCIMVHIPSGMSFASQSWNLRLLRNAWLFSSSTIAFRPTRSQGQVGKNKLFFFGMGTLSSLFFIVVSLFLIWWLVLTRRCLQASDSIYGYFRQYYSSSAVSEVFEDRGRSPGFSGCSLNIFFLFSFFLCS